MANGFWPLTRFTATRGAEVEIIARTNPHNQTLSIDGEEMGGGPYELCVNRAHAPVSVRRLPVWARGWPDVWTVLRACVTAFELAPTDRQPMIPGATVDYARALWACASSLARRGKPVTCWTVLAALHPAPRVPRAPRRQVGRVLTHDPTTGEPVIIYGGRGPQGLDGGTIVVGGHRTIR